MQSISYLVLRVKDIPNRTVVLEKLSSRTRIAMKAVSLSLVNDQTRRKENSLEVAYAMFGILGVFGVFSVLADFLIQKLISNLKTQKVAPQHV